ncbi:MAG: GNAT family N-acyltransferase [Woeseiaceae bacterium]|nr:GNAT family N-acyltransferase [Woeseiaceae bacterium]
MSDSRTMSLTVRLAETDAEVVAAQKLRFEVFSRVRDAAFSDEATAERRDIDPYDPYCDHLIVVDPSREGEENLGIIGTYRMMARSKRREPPGFYTDRYFDLACFDGIDGEIVEMGRVCIDADYRSRAVMQWLWKGIANYVLDNNVKVLFGCAGWDGIDANRHRNLLSYLHNQFLAPERIRPVAKAGNRLEFERLPPAEVDDKAALAEIPSIIRGYSRMGGYIGDGAVMNHAFNTTMVCIVVEMAGLTKRYMKRFIGR